jgi:CRP-like cAMP-binding protein
VGQLEPTVPEAAMITTHDLLASHPFVQGMPVDTVNRLAAYAKRQTLPAGRVVFREGGRADRFWLIREGRVALDLHVAGRGDVVIDQLGPGSLLGWSWLFPPYTWQFSAVAAEQTLTLELDAAGVRRLCDEDPTFGYRLTRRVAEVLAGRLQATRMRVIELYGYPQAAVS